MSFTQPVTCKFKDNSIKWWNKAQTTEQWIQRIIFPVKTSGLVIFSVKIHVKLSHDSLFAVKISIDFSENWP